MAYAPLSLEEREEISRGLIAEPTVLWAKLGCRLGRHRATIAREVDRNGGRDEYRPAVAQKAAIEARRRPRSLVLAEPGELRDRVTAELRDGRSPVAIWADMNAGQVPGAVRPETIYQAICNGVLDVKARECLRTRRPRRRPRQARQASSRPALPNIAARPVEMNNRAEAGHWEADQIIGKANKSSMLWLSERVSRFSIGITMPNGYSAGDVLAGLVEACEQIPAHMLRSITFDQGSEWTDWKTLAATYGIDCWFCDPHSPWQRGQIENLNRQWRWWFPRGTDLAIVTPDEADRVAAIINNQRRRSLNYDSPQNRYDALRAR